ncbi:hypothetical protein K239x_35120 [Planctomycetes bacterium K23_9]|uniref:Uncharacterized protein n=1 Tax=Stieleria marina TaxID=1930275 RepID=A0A517NWL7_9BACT|nr:hypothetical protein K239x_35120 [Planctomycetes bacterium K23_9]
MTQSIATVATGAARVDCRVVWVVITQTTRKAGVDRDSGRGFPAKSGSILGSFAEPGLRAATNRSRRSRAWC